MDFENEMKQCQIIKIKTLAGILDCSEEQASIIRDYLIKHEFIENLENENSYFVLRDNIGGLKIALKAMLKLCRLKFK